MAVHAFISGLAGTILSPAEHSFLREAEPWGVILFARNVDAPGQVSRLTKSVRDALGRDAPVLVDQEGGRVQRLGPPHWPSYPPGAVYGLVYDRNPAEGQRAAYLGAYLMAADLIAVGIDVDCLPIADVPVAGASSVIGDRAYGQKAEKVASIARSVADGLLGCGVLPVLKHIPGHGRAAADSHDRLPVVEADCATLRATDFAAFRPLSDLPMGMTAHVVYSAIDPLAPATISVTVVGEVIRDWLGFSGLLMTDDISMGALSGSLAERSRAAIAAGCDLVLHCTGKLDEMQEVAGAVPILEGSAAARAQSALARRRVSGKLETGELRSEWTTLVNQITGSRRASL
ncbi:MAG TPA: beta-N-acetylhexosaminidase [Pseudomonadota bacterium]|nr:beta-N-acetylhexosaminidase [Pseudomonadota bacterium]